MMRIRKIELALKSFSDNYSTPSNLDFEKVSKQEHAYTPIRTLEHILVSACNSFLVKL